MNRKVLNQFALGAAVVGALAIGGFAVSTPARAQPGPYYDYAPGPVSPWGTIVANANPSVPFNPPDAALAYRHGRNYGFCGFTIAGC